MEFFISFHYACPFFDFSTDTITFRCFLPNLMGFRDAALYFRRIVRNEDYRVTWQVTIPNFYKEAFLQFCTLSIVLVLLNKTIFDSAKNFANFAKSYRPVFVQDRAMIYNDMSRPIYRAKFTATSIIKVDRNLNRRRS